MTPERLRELRVVHDAVQKMVVDLPLTNEEKCLVMETVGTDTYEEMLSELEQIGYRDFLL